MPDLDRLPDTSDSDSGPSSGPREPSRRGRRLLAAGSAAIVLVAIVDALVAVGIGVLAPAWCDPSQYANPNCDPVVGPVVFSLLPAASSVAGPVVLVRARRAYHQHRPWGKAMVTAAVLVTAPYWSWMALLILGSALR